MNTPVQYGGAVAAWTATGFDAARVRHWRVFFAIIVKRSAAGKHTARRTAASSSKPPGFDVTATGENGSSRGTGRIDGNRGRRG